MNGVFIQIPMSRFFDLATGTNLKSWLQQDNLLRSQVVQATTQTPASRVKTACLISHCTINAREVLLSIDFVSISEVLVKVLLLSNSRYPFFYIFAHNRSCPRYLAKFQSITNNRTHVF